MRADARPSFAALLHHVRRKRAHPALLVYYRWAALMVVLNVAVAVSGWSSGWLLRADAATLGRLSLIAQLNLVLGTLVRQQHVVNLLSAVATRAPVTWPLSVRWALGKVHHLGGVHIGAAIGGSVWYLFFAVGVARAGIRDEGTVTGANVLLSLVIGVLLVSLCALAMPPVRRRAHDVFEVSHRIGGWSLLVAVWINAVVFVAHQRPDEPVIRVLLTSPTTLLVLLSTALAVEPWLRLRRVAVTVERPSDHAAVVRLAHGSPPPIGSTRAISRSAVLGWHSFANVPAAPGEDGYRMLVSRAGDWTSELIDEPPTHVWVRGTPVVGVANARKLFRRVVFVATGSGIGPLLGHVLADQGNGHLIWVTRNPVRTYGADLVNEILGARPDADVWDTSQRGKPDLFELALQAVRDTGAEAVICVANQQVTWQVVQGLEARGIPAFGAIWDS
ncbi:hypothetical protein VV02_13000 [Luteipulveratus mongoliensis]|uniref:Uncharacterized protein n=2 Tax=Luteipulveratus mongoliensis TaxID=571913 RepID=A0A0K1JQ97_9MICO|nr:hypothetical protein VV02_13000 [Luteipulveratus mongoliensis]